MVLWWADANALVTTNDPSSTQARQLVVGVDGAGADLVNSIKRRR